MDQAEGQSVTGEHLPEAMGALIREIFRATIDRVEHQFDDTDLILSQWLALKLIGAGMIVWVGDVGRELEIETGASTRLVDQLENRGLLDRCRSATDRRVVGIALTNAGKVVMDNMQPRLARFWRDQLDIFSAEERDLLFGMLLRSREKFGVDSASAPASRVECG